MANRNKAAQATTVENAQAQAAVENTQAQVESKAQQAQVESKAQQAQVEAKRLAEAAKEAAEAAKKAAAEAKEAAKKAKAFGSRPIRKSYFAVHCVPVDEPIAEYTLTGEFGFKSDVHYCAEKEAIDMVASLREQERGNDYVYAIYKVSKEQDEDGDPKSVALVSKVYMDPVTGQIVID